MRIAGATVVISGASSGIGAATAVEMARRGARAVALLARTPGALAEVAAAVAAAGAAPCVLPIDLADGEATAATAARLLAELGPPDVLVNNAGAGRWLHTEDTSPAEAAAMIAVPYLAAFGLTRALLPAMLDRRRGSIVQITSPAGFLAWPGATAYAVARWAMRGFSAALRADLHGTGLHVGLVVAGEVASPYFAHNPGSHERLPRISRLARVLTVDEVARLVVRAVERERHLTAAPWLVAATLALHRFFPGLVDRLVIGTGVRREAARGRH